MVRKKIVYGNPYNGFISPSRRKVEQNLTKIGKGGRRFRITHRVHQKDRTISWIIGLEGIR